MDSSKRERLLRCLGLITEASSAISIIEIVSNHRMLIENHKGILLYNDNNIQIQTGDGAITVLGEDLELSYMSDFQIVISGRIISVSLNGG